MSKLQQFSASGSGDWDLPLGQSFFSNTDKIVEPFYSCGCRENTYLFFLMLMVANKLYVQSYTIN